jgi:hypothetical protein
MPSGHARMTYALMTDGEVEYLSVSEKGMLRRNFSDLTSGVADAVPVYLHYFGKQSPENLPDDDSIEDLAASMVDLQQATPGQVPAGYTYLTQFIFHDLTWFSDKGQMEENRASAALDMDSVLGNRRFPEAEPGCPGSSDALRVGLTLNGYGDLEVPLPGDIPRKPGCQPQSDADRYPAGYPLIPDTRNEGFLQLAQMHVVFLKFYNEIARMYGFGTENFDEDAARLVFMQHVQSVALYDVLERLIDTAVYADVVVGNRRRVIHPCPIADTGPFLIPIEFAAAAARFGHSMVRESYDWNATHRGSRPAELISLITLSHQNSWPGASRLRRLPRDWVVDWLHFFDFSPMLGAAAPVPAGANPIGPRLAETMGNLPEHLREVPPGRVPPPEGATFNLARETLRRQVDLMMASAQEAIRQANRYLPQQMQIAQLQPTDLAGGSQSRSAAVFDRHPELFEMTPIWYYVLREAELVGGGERLGPFGSRLVAETIHAAIEASGASAITAVPGWTPSLPACQQQFRMIDLIACACGSM